MSRYGCEESVGAVGLAAYSLCLETMRHDLMHYKKVLHRCMNHMLSLASNYIQMLIFLQSSIHNRKVAGTST